MVAYNGLLSAVQRKWQKRHLASSSDVKRRNGMKNFPMSALAS